MISIPRISDRWRIIILAFYWVTGFVLTHIPLNHGEPAIPNVDKYAHFCLYMGLCFFVAYWLGSKRDTTVATIFAIGLCALYGLLDEGIQYFVPTRNPSWGDWIADSLGAIAGGSTYWIIRSFRNSNESAPSPSNEA